ncbi:unnamed protein product, partial [Musa hybrid cultivar]
NQWSRGVENGDCPSRVGEESKRVGGFAKRVHQIEKRDMRVPYFTIRATRILNGYSGVVYDFCGQVKNPFSRKWCGTFRREGQQHCSGTCFSEVSSSLDILSVTV